MDVIVFNPIGFFRQPQCKRARYIYCCVCVILHRASQSNFYINSVYSFVSSHGRNSTTLYQDPYFDNNTHPHMTKSEYKHWFQGSTSFKTWILKFTQDPCRIFGKFIKTCVCQNPDPCYGIILCVQISQSYGSHLGLIEQSV